MEYLNFMLVIITVLTLVVILMLISIPFKNGLPAWFTCKMMGWHGKVKIDNSLSDSVNFQGSCQKCNRTVIQDSQGNWF